MKWDEIWKIVLGILAGAGGIGGIILAIVGLSSKIIAKRLEEEYSLKIDKELEKYKSGLDNKIYISKTKFDTEFSIYRELSKVYFDMVANINTLIPYGVANFPADPEEREEYDKKNYLDTLKAHDLAQDALNSNAPFIQNDLFEKYSELLQLCRWQTHAFEKRWNLSFKGLPMEQRGLSDDDYKRTNEINEKFTALNNNLREYLSKLDVID